MSIKPPMTTIMWCFLYISMSLSCLTNLLLLGNVKEPLASRAYRCATENNDRRWKIVMKFLNFIYHLPTEDEGKPHCQLINEYYLKYPFPYSPTKI